MEASEEVAGAVESAKSRRAQRTCSYCNEKGHTKRTCEKRKSDEARANAEGATQPDEAPPAPMDPLMPTFDASERAAPEENIRTIEQLCGKYRVGEDIDMTVQIHRMWPQFYSDGRTKATGYLEESPSPITTGYIASTFGGGKYACMVYGPATTGNGRRVYARCTVEIPGKMNENALNRIAREEQMGTVGTVQQHGPAAPIEAPAVATKAMEIMGSMQERTQQRMEALEQQVLSKTDGDNTVLHLVREMADTQAKTALEAMERSAEREREAADRAIGAEREARRELAARLEALERDSRRSSNDDVQRFNTVLGQSTESAERIQSNMIERHNEALRAARESHEQTVRAMREAHEAEKRTLNENRERDLQAADQRWQSKIDRLEDQIKRLEEDRRRDRDEYDRRMREREDNMRARQEDEKKLIDTTWQARLNTAEAAHESRIQGLEERLGLLREELQTAKGQVAMQGDAFAQIEKARSLIDLSRDVGGGSSSGESKDETTLDKILGVVGSDFTGVLNALLNGGAGAGAPPGMVPVQFAPGAPQHAMMGQMGAGAPMAPGLPQPPRPNVMAGPPQPVDLNRVLDDEDWEEEENLRAREEHERRQRRRSVARTTQQPAPAQAPRPVPAPPHAGPQPAGPTQAQIAQAQQQAAQNLQPMEIVMVGNFIQRALDHGDDPDEFAMQIFEHLNPQQIGTLLTLGPDNVLKLIQQHSADSQALSPAGQRLTHDTFHEMLNIARQAQAAQQGR